MEFPMWIVGVLLAVLASVISNLGYNLQKLAHVRNDRAAAEEQRLLDAEGSYSPVSPTHNATGNGESEQELLNQARSDAAATDKKKANYTKQGIWQLGFLFVIGGSFFDFAALAFAGQSVVAPLGSLTLVTNVLWAPVLLGEKVSRRDLLSTAAIVAGAALAVVFASHQDSIPTTSEMFSLFLTTRFVVYLVLMVATIALLRYFIHWIKGIKKNTPEHYRPLARYHRFAYACAAGIMGAQSVLFAKCTAQLLANTITGAAILFVYVGSYFVLIGLGVTIFFQVKWLNSGLRLFHALYIVPVFQSFWILISVVSGMVFFGEYQDFVAAGWRALMFLLGIVLTIGGVYVLSQRDPGQTEQIEPARTPLLTNGDSASPTFSPQDVIIEQPSPSRGQRRATLGTLQISSDEAEAEPSSIPGRTQSLFPIGGYNLLSPDEAFDPDVFGKFVNVDITGGQVISALFARAPETPTPVKRARAASVGVRGSRTRHTSGGRDARSTLTLADDKFKLDTSSLASTPEDGPLPPAAISATPAQALTAATSAGSVAPATALAPGKQSTDSKLIDVNATVG